MTWKNAAVWALAGAVVVGAWGCRRRAPVQDGRMGAREHRQLMSYAQRHTGCDARTLTASLISNPPSVYTVTGCTQPIEYWQRCSRRRCRWERVVMLNEVAAQVLQCPPQQIQQQPTQSPNMRYATGCGMSAPFQIGCDGRQCGWSPTGPVQAAGGQSVAVAPAQQPGVVVQPPQSNGAQVAPGASLQAQIQAQREVILSCIDSGPLSLHLRWTAQGQVIIQLPPELAGSAAEGCIQAAIGALQVSAQQAGEVVVPVQ